MVAPKLWGVALVLAFVPAACDVSSVPATAPPSTTTDAAIEAPRAYALGGVP